MKFFYCPRTCSLGINILLEELGVSYNAEYIDIFSGGQTAPSYLSRNPKGKIPAIERDDGSVLTEFQAIAFWLCRSFPDAGLMPENLDEQVRVLENLDHIVGTIHMRGFTLFIAPQKFASTEAGQAEIAECGRQTVVQAFLHLAETLGEREYLLGNYSAADAAMFYVVDWAVAMNFVLPENLRTYHARMKERPAVQRALAVHAPAA